MGMDQYAYRVKKENVFNAFYFHRGHRLQNGFDTLGNEVDYFTWDDFPELYKFMKDIYEKKGGKKEFNLITIQLSAEDLYRLYEAAQQDEFYKDNYIETKKNRTYKYDYLMEFIHKARKAMKDGDYIYYEPWY